MQAESCVLVHPFTGKQICRLTPQEANVMEERGNAVCIRKRGRKTNLYRHVVPVDPSSSEESMAMLTTSDTRAIAGLSMPDVEQAERLDGWGFEMDGAFCDACKRTVRLPHEACA